MIFNTLGARDEMVWIVIPDNKTCGVNNEGVMVSLLARGERTHIWQDLNGTANVGREVQETFLLKKERDDPSIDCQSTLGRSAMLEKIVKESP